MLQIRVVSVAGQPPATPIVAQFGPAGGSIGRNEGNTLVLPDEAKTISRQHALIQMQGQGYVLLDKGANPTLRNRVPVGAGQVVPLEPGDELCIGPYVLTVERPAAAAFDHAAHFQAGAADQQTKLGLALCVTRGAEVQCDQ